MQLQLVAFETAFSSGPLLIEADIHPLGHLHYFLMYSVCASLEELKRWLKENLFGEVETGTTGRP